MTSDFIDIAVRASPLLLKGAVLTLKISLVGVGIGLIFGTMLGIANCDRLRNRYLGAVVNVYVTIWRGTPIFVQLLFVYFAIPDAVGIELSPVSAGIVTLGLNSGAYLSETIRGGINSVPEGQWEAAHVLGYSQFQTLRFIVMSQALKTVIPGITNELVTLIKDSSILMVVGVPELVKMSRDIVARELNPIEVYALAAIFYLIMTSAVAGVAKKVERRLS